MNNDVLSQSAATSLLAAAISLAALSPAAIQRVVTPRQSSPVYTIASQSDYDKIHTLLVDSGATIRFKGGQVFRGGLSVTASGDNSRPITITSYGAGPATIDSGDATAVTVTDASNVAIVKIAVRGSWIPTTNFDPVSPRYGIAVVAEHRPVSHVSISDCSATGFKDAGVRVEATTLPNRMTDVEIRRCSANRNGINGINVEGGYSTTDPTTPKGVKNLQIRDCVANENHGCFRLDKDGYTGHGTFAQGIYVSGIDGGRIDHCLALRNGGIRKRALQYYDGNEKMVKLRLRGPGGLGIWAYISNDLTIQWCEAGDTTSEDGDGGGFDLDGGCTHCVVQYCYSHGTHGDGIMACPEEWSNRWGYRISDDTIRYNVVERLTGSAAGLDLVWYEGCAPAYNIAFYNNDVYLDRQFGGRRLGSDFQPIGISLGNAAFDSNTICANNIICTNDGVPALRYIGADPPNGAHLRLDSNTYFSPISATFEWKGAVVHGLETLRNDGFEVHGKTMDPGLLLVGNGGRIWSQADEGPAGCQNGVKRFEAWKPYRLKPGSPLRHVGALLKEPPFNVRGIGTSDLYGNPLPAKGISIGAFQLL